MDFCRAGAEVFEHGSVKFVRNYKLSADISEFRLRVAVLVTFFVNVLHKVLVVALLNHFLCYVA